MNLEYYLLVWDHCQCACFVMKRSSLGCNSMSRKVPTSSLSRMMLWPDFVTLLHTPITLQHRITVRLDLAVLFARYSPGSYRITQWQVWHDREIWLFLTVGRMLDSHIHIWAFVIFRWFLPCLESASPAEDRPSLPFLPFRQGILALRGFSWWRTDQGTSLPIIFCEFFVWGVDLVENNQNNVFRRHLPFSCSEKALAARAYCFAKEQYLKVYDWISFDQQLWNTTFHNQAVRSTNQKIPPWFAFSMWIFFRLDVIPLGPVQSGSILYINQPIEVLFLRLIVDSKKKGGGRALVSKTCRHSSSKDFVSPCLHNSHPQLI